MLSIWLPSLKKESYKWIESAIKCKQALAGAREVILIQDREADIYEQFCLVPDAHTHLLIRAKTNRILSDQTRLFEHLAGLPKQGDYQITLEGDKRKGLKKRTATIEVRFSPVTISRNHYNDKNTPESKDLYATKSQGSHRRN
jgi:hypothetical protein